MTRSLVLFALLTASACASDEADPELGQEILFLTACSSDTECGDLTCLCGVCTTPCTSTCSVGVCATPDEPAFTSYCASTSPTAGLCLQACVTDADCSEGACFDGLCAAVEGATATCSTDSDCASGPCVDGTCSHFEADPVPCTTDADCGSGVCLDGTCTTAESDPSDLCMTDSDCGSGVCLDGICTAP